MPYVEMFVRINGGHSKPFLLDSVNLTVGELKEIICYRFGEHPPDMLLLKHRTELKDELMLCCYEIGKNSELHLEYNKNGPSAIANRQCHHDANLLAYKVIAKRLSENERNFTSLKFVSEWHNPKRFPWASVDELPSVTDICDEGVVLIAKALSVNTTLRELVILPYCTRSNNDALRSMSIALGMNQFLTTFVWGGWNAAPGALVILSDGLKKNSILNLFSLYTENCDDGNDSVKAITSLLKVNRSLRSILYLGHGRTITSAYPYTSKTTSGYCTDAEAIELANVLKVTPLTSLVTRFAFSVKGFKLLADAVRNNKALHLQIQHCNTVYMQFLDEKISINVNVTDTVEEMKRLILEKRPSFMNSEKLMFNGVQLDDYETCAFYEITEGSCLTLAPSRPSFSMDQYFQCTICMDTCVDPCTASCGLHNFCLDHLKEWVAVNAKKPKGATCPVCRLKIQQSPADCRINIGIRDAIDAMRVRGTGQGSSDKSVHNVMPMSRPPLISYESLSFETNKRQQRVEIGRGAFSSVYAATFLGEPVAVKTLALPAGGTVDPALEALFWRESTLQYHLRHPGVAELHGVYLDRDVEGGPITELALIMPRFACSLEGALFPVSTTVPPMTDRVNWLWQIVEALRFLHARGVVHGDMKPANILLDTKRRMVKVCDFGHARLRREGEDSSQSLGAVGTPRYRDPSVATGHNLFRKASDVYSLSIIIWQILCAAIPFEGMDVAAVLTHTVSGGRPPLDRLPSAQVLFGTLLQNCWASVQGERFTVEVIYTKYKVRRLSARLLALTVV